MIKRHLKYIFIFGITFSIFLILAGCSLFPGIPTIAPSSPESPAPSATAVTGSQVPSGSPSVANGQNIYLYATSDSGQPITYTGGPSGMMMPGQLSCATCHGPEGHGGTVHFMMQTYDVPNITWPVLTGPDMDHPPYTEETLKRAITQGIDPGGSSLEYPMPRWQMSASDLNDLVAFIKTLK